MGDREDKIPFGDQADNMQLGDQGDKTINGSPRGPVATPSRDPVIHLLVSLF